MTETIPKPLDWARRLHAIAQSGLAWEPHDHERERYEQVRRVAAEMLARCAGDVEAVEGLLAAETGHATPKIDVRGVVFRGDEILLVQETLAAGFFARSELPTSLRFADATRHQIERCFEQREHPEWPTDFD